MSDGNSKDRAILRDLARQVAEVASLPVMAERREMWRRHNRRISISPWADVDVCAEKRMKGVETMASGRPRRHCCNSEDRQSASRTVLREGEPS